MLKTEGLYRRGNGVWYIDFTTPSGKRVRRSARTKDKKSAEELRDKLKHDAWRVSQLGEKPKRLWDEAALKWLKEKAAKRSIEDDKSKIRMLTQFRGVYLHHIDNEFVMNVVGNLNCKDSTKNRYLSLIISILNAAAKKWKWIDKAPYIEKYKENEGRVRWLKPAEAQRLIGVAKPRYFADLIIFSLNTGLRQSNVLNLKWSQIDLDRKVAWCYPDEMKAGRALGVVLNEAAIEVLRRQIGKHSDYVFVNKRGNPIVGINSRYWKKSLELANITDFTWHDLRHTWASWLVQRGVPLRVLQEMGGWKTLSMVQRYAHLSSEHLQSHAQILSDLVNHTENDDTNLSQ
ncbi:integrase [Neisseria dumasiana]|uniref:Integrase n=1 Tax=Neisseria dumasiana TaxID=1931275 RepID=A0A1X3DF36_9NEIS|nr:integrase [Neisseria dumasiana]